MTRLEKILTFKETMDAERVKTRTYREVVEITGDFLEDGYSIKDLKALRSGLKAVAVKGKPTTSLSRLINGLQNTKSLNRLDDLIEERGKTLETFNAKINVADFFHFFFGYPQTIKPLAYS